ncbi:MAG: Glutathione peroxidase family protein [Devosia sp.]|nr:Glutathione peroxidase family protein [Devosia sp.]
MTTLYDFSAPKLLGGTQNFGDFRGKPVLIVNVASKCGLTPQYEGLEALWERYRGAGLGMFGFPCNQFAEQEPGSATDIAQFCQSMYSVSFPLMGKVEINGDDADPLFAWLRAAAPNPDGSTDVKWNFNKFLIDKSGTKVTRVQPPEAPETMAPLIERLLS